jgi:hypothetical protein
MNGLDPKFEKLMQAMQEAQEIKESGFSSLVEKEVEVSPLIPSQQAVMEAIITSMKSGNKKHILAGSAGVGKTFMVKYLIREFRKLVRPFGEVYITAPTNRAVAVLHDKEPEAPYYMEFKTIHSALYLKRKINEKTGDISFVPDYNPTKERPFKGVTLLVVDESSMLNSELLYYIENPAYNDTFMLFIGDNKQLNPVGETHSPIFGRPAIDGKEITVVTAGGDTYQHIVPHYETYELTEIIRQAAGNPIIELSRNLHNISLLEEKLNEEGQGYQYTEDFEFVVNRIIADGDRIRYLAWTNAEVNSMNETVRKRIYGNPKKVELGETIIFTEPYGGRNTGDLYYTNYELEVRTIEIKELTFNILSHFKTDSGKVVDLEVPLTFYWVNKDIMIIHEDSYYKFLDTCKYLRSLTKDGLKWKTYYNFTEMFAKFGYRYALTVHKAQGGTFDTVIINMKDMNRNKSVHEKPRLWYTGITRASKNVFMYIAPFVPKV